MTFIIDYGIRNIEAVYVDGIRAMAHEIIQPKYVATGDAATWAWAWAMSDFNAILDYVGTDTNGNPLPLEDTLDNLVEVWESAREHLYNATGLHAHEPGDGLYFLTDDEVASLDY